MAQWNVLIYDGNDGQLRAGLGPWEQVREWKQQALLSSDADAPQKVRALEDFFAGLDAEVREVSSYEEAMASIAETDVLVVCKGRVDQALLDQAGRLKEVHMIGFDTAQVDAEELRARGIPLVQVPLTNFLAVAEHAFALLLGLVKRLQESQQRAKAGTDWMVIPGNYRLVRDMTVGVLGVGEIGLAFVRLLKPWGARILYHDLRPNPALEAETGAEFASWQEIFEKSDVLSVHLPLVEGTEGIIGADEFARMKRGALFLNTARGGVVDEAELIEALKKGQIGGAGLDVFAEEPLPVESELHNFKNVILTPHVAWAGPWTLVNDVNALLGGAAEAVRMLGIGVAR